MSGPALQIDVSLPVSHPWQIDLKARFNPTLVTAIQGNQCNWATGSQLELSREILCRLRRERETWDLSKPKMV